MNRIHVRKWYLPLILSLLVASCGDTPTNPNNPPGGNPQPGGGTTITHPQPAPPVCGNNKLEKDEVCDGIRFGTDTCMAHGYQGGSLTCSSDCKSVTFEKCTDGCGNGVREGAEECDGSDFKPGDSCQSRGKGSVGTLTCSDTCTVVDTTCSCGDGKVDAGEECDDKTVANGDGCDISCKVEPGWTCTYDNTQKRSVCTEVCGDGIKTDDEVCDNGDGTNLQPGCEDKCKKVTAGYVCDDTTKTVNGKTVTTSDCHTVCGDGIKAGSEVCDNGVGGTIQTGCKSDCSGPTDGYTCTEDSTGLSTCAETCGDGKVTGTEVCDNGDGTNLQPGCVAGCKAVTEGYYCDNQTGKSVCTPRKDYKCDATAGTCAKIAGVEHYHCDDKTGQNCSEDPGWHCKEHDKCEEKCGDGVKTDGEACDDIDGKPASGDGCSATCQLETGYVCSVASGAKISTCTQRNDYKCDSGTCTKIDHYDCGTDGTNCQADGGYKCTDKVGCVKSCGDGKPDTGEACDDNNDTADDGCSATCKVETGYTCTTATATTPSTCTMMDGYKKDGATVKPIPHYTCDTKGTCSADTGYTCATPHQDCTLKEDYKEVSGAAVKIDHYTCTAPGSCTSDTGWYCPGAHQDCTQRDDYKCDAGTCTKIAHYTCDRDNANCQEDAGYMCTAKDKCVLLDGYKEVSGKATPIDHYTCTGHTCTADTGYICATPHQDCTQRDDYQCDPMASCTKIKEYTCDADGTNCKAEKDYKCTPKDKCVKACGDGVLDSGEECDTGVSGGHMLAGCTDTCTVETGYTCSGNSGAKSTCTMMDGYKYDSAQSRAIAIPHYPCDTQTGKCTPETGYMCPTAHHDCTMMDGYKDVGGTATPIPHYTCDAQGTCTADTGYMCPTAHKDCTLKEDYKDDGTGAVKIKHYTCTGTSCTSDTGWYCAGNHKDCVQRKDYTCDSDGSNCNEIPGAAHYKCDTQTGQKCTPDDGWHCTDFTSCLEQCGDGVKTDSEACDNAVSGSMQTGCTSSCQFESGYTCTVQSGQKGSTCTKIDLCGDGKVDSGEECDDNNKSDHDGCSATCQKEAGYDCTGGSATSQSTCTLRKDYSCDSTGCKEIVGAEHYHCDKANGQSCTPDAGWHCTAHDKCEEQCGDGVKTDGEQCDDHNKNDNDGCSSKCGIETGYTCEVPSSQTQSTCTLRNDYKCDSTGCTKIPGAEHYHCDAKGVCSSDPTYNCTAHVACTPKPVCGNGKVEKGEQCDDNGTSDGDGCSSTCQKEEGYICTGGSATTKSTCAQRDDYTCPALSSCTKIPHYTCDTDGQNCHSDEGYVCTPQTGCTERNDYHCDSSGCTKISGAEHYHCDDNNPQNCTPDAGYTCTPHDKCTKAPVCGDSKKEGTEQCDDGNKNDHDGCSSTCQIEPGYKCDLGDGQPCRPTTCGDGSFDGSIEECDTVGGLYQANATKQTCTQVTGKSDATGNPRCTNTCKIDMSACAYCGDGKINNSEQCDGSDLGGKTTCEQVHPGMYSNPTQPVTCNSTCGYDTSLCHAKPTTSGPTTPYLSEVVIPDGYYYRKESGIEITNPTDQEQNCTLTIKADGSTHTIQLNALPAHKASVVGGTNYPQSTFMKNPEVQIYHPESIALSCAPVGGGSEVLVDSFGQQNGGVMRIEGTFKRICNGGKITLDTDLSTSFILSDAWEGPKHGLYSSPDYSTMGKIETCAPPSTGGGGGAGGSAIKGTTPFLSEIVSMPYSTKKRGNAIEVYNPTNKQVTCQIELDGTSTNISLNIPANSTAAVCEASGKGTVYQKKQCAKTNQSLKDLVDNNGDVHTIILKCGGKTTDSFGSTTDGNDLDLDWQGDDYFSDGMTLRKKCSSTNTPDEDPDDSFDFSSNGSWSILKKAVSKRFSDIGTYKCK